MRRLCAVLLFIVLLCLPLFGEKYQEYVIEDGFSQALFITTGLGYWGEAQSKYIFTFTAGWQGWLAKNRVFGFYFDFHMFLQENNSLGDTSFGVTVQPIKLGIVEPYVWLGFMYGRTETKKEIYDMPISTGANVWFWEGGGLKAQLRFFPFSGEGLFDVSAGFFVKM